MKKKLRKVLAFQNMNDDQKLTFFSLGAKMI